MKETISLNIQISECRNSIMGVAILSIMLFHQYFISMIPFNFFHKFGYWGVDIFLFISGMGLVNSLKKNTKKDYYKRRFIRIIPSCLLCGTTKYIVFILFYSSLFILKDGLKIGIWSIASLDLWYIHTIIILYIISPIIFKSLNKNKYLTIAIILFLFLLNGIFLKPIVDYDWLSPKGIISWTIERLPVFTLGMYLSIYNRITNKFIYISSFPLLLAICLNLIEKTQYSFYGIRPCLLFLLTLGMPFLIVACIYLLKNIPYSMQKLLAFLGKYSLELYLVHEFIFLALIIYFKNRNPSLLLIIGFLLSFFSAYLCRILTNIIKQI